MSIEMATIWPIGHYTETLRSEAARCLGVKLHRGNLGALILLSSENIRMLTSAVSASIQTHRSPTEPKSLVVKFRSTVDGSELSSPWRDVSASTLQDAAPWRTFRWHRGQKHYSGTYWSATQHAHVVLRVAVGTSQAPAR